MSTPTSLYERHEPVAAVKSKTAPRVDHELCTDCGACTMACRVFSQVPDAVGVR